MVDLDDLLGEEPADRRTVVQAHMLMSIQGEPACDQADLAERLERPSSDVGRMLEELRDEGLIRQGGGIWSLTEAGEEEAERLSLMMREVGQGLARFSSTMDEYVERNVVSTCGATGPRSFRALPNPS